MEMFQNIDVPLTLVVTALIIGCIGTVMWYSCLISSE